MIETNYSNDKIMTIKIKCLVAVFFLLNGIAALAQQNAMQAMGKANAKVARASSHQVRWDGPTDGPKLQSKKRVVFVAADMTNTVIAELYKGIREAAAVGSWEVLLIDCRGGCHQGAPVISQAIAMKPDGIVLAGIDAVSQSAGLSKARERNIAVVGWHALARPAVIDGLVVDIGNNPRDAAQIAALFGVTDAGSRMGLVILSDSSTPYLAAKSVAAAEIIRQCESCRLLSIEELPLSEAGAKMPALTADLLRRFGAKWTHVLAVSDIYFDIMDKPAVALPLAGNHLRGISAGDGSASAYQRIRANQLQIGTIPEPVGQQGWQIVDELNRAFSAVHPSGLMTAVHLVSEQNIAFDGGAKNSFDPDNDYRNQYKKIWLPQ